MDVKNVQDIHPKWIAPHCLSRYGSWSEWSIIPVVFLLNFGVNVFFSLVQISITVQRLSPLESRFRKTILFQTLNISHVVQSIWWTRSHGEVYSNHFHSYILYSVLFLKVKLKMCNVLRNILQNKMQKHIQKCTVLFWNFFFLGYKTFLRRCKTLYLKQFSSVNLKNVIVLDVPETLFVSSFVIHTIFLH